jgi:hypothetical protein
MTDDTTNRTGEPEMGSSSDDTFAWTEPEATSAEGSAKAREWLAQLQAMMENLATQAAPVVREVGAKAAELAAMAGEKAGPVAQKAAEMTGQAGQKLAVKGRDLAAEWRRDAAASKAATSETAADIADATEDAPASDSIGSDEPTTTGVV